MHLLSRTLPLFLSAIASAQQAPPSQRELNGFLVGQHADVLRGSFSELLQDQKTPDGWPYRVYTLDRSHGAYMAFKFAPDRPDYIYSIQIAGEGGTDMHPFLGLRLGDGRDAVVTQLGRPSRTKRNRELKLEVLEYARRNYSVELDSAGRLYSIQVFGYEGFPDRPRDTIPSLHNFARAITGRDADALLEALTPDFEIYQRDSTYRFAGSARADLLDSTSAVSRLLYAGSSSVARILADSTLLNSADLSLRVYGRLAPAFVYKFPATTPITELVFQAQAGRWRVWEIRFR